MKSIFYLFRIVYAYILFCFFLNSSCTNDWFSEQSEDQENVQTFDVSVGSVEIKGPAGSYFVDAGSYHFQAVPPAGWDFTYLTWSVSGAGGKIEGFNTLNPIAVSFNQVGYADIMITCGLISGGVERSHVQVLTVKVINQYPILTIDKEVELSKNGYLANVSYSSRIEAVSFEWSIPANVSYTSSGSQIKLIYPNVGSYKIGVRAKDGNHYSDWVYEIVTVLGDMSVAPFYYELNNNDIGGFNVGFEIIISHNNYPESSITCYRNSDRIMANTRYYSYDYMDDIMLVRGDYTITLRNEDYSGGWSEYVYPITINEGGGFAAKGFMSGWSFKWIDVGYYDNDGTDYEF